MAIKLLFNQPVKAGRKCKPPKLGRESYDDTTYLYDLFNSNLSEAEFVRVRLVRNEPVPSYRISILRRYKESHSVMFKGTSVLLKPGLYVVNQYFCERVSPKEYVFSPPLEEK